MKVVFQAGEQFEGLQAVYSERFEKVVVGSEFFAGDFEVRRRKGQNFIKRLICCGHRSNERSFVYFISVSEWVALRQIGQGICALNKFSQTRFDGWP